MPSNFLDELAADEEEGNQNVLLDLASDAPHASVADQEPTSWWKRAASELIDPAAWKRSLGVVARGAIQGLESPITLPADFAIAVRNKLTGEDTPSLSQLRDEELDTILPRPESKMEKVNSFVAGVLSGSRIPSPGIKNPAPAGFVGAKASAAQQVLDKSREAGYVIPPTTTNPSMVNKMAEGFAGKLTTAQQASMRNQEVTNELARKALKLRSGEPITAASLEDIRKTAGKVYEQIADAGEITADAQFLDDLAQLGRGADEISQAFPGANVGATKQIGEVVDSLLQEKFSSKAALQYLRELRKQSSANLSGVNFADPAKQSLGMAQREAAATLEDLIERHLHSVGKGDIADSFAGARKMIAMSHSVEKALNESTGNVVAGKLGQQLAKGKPLSGELELAANFARAFPKASKEVTESMPGISPLDYVATTGAAVAAGNPLPLAALGARPAVRNMLLSPWWQRSTVEKPFVVPENIGIGPSTLLQAGQEASR